MSNKQTKKSEEGASDAAGKNNDFVDILAAIPITQHPQDRPPPPRGNKTRTAWTTNLGKWSCTDPALRPTKTDRHTQ